VVTVIGVTASVNVWLTVAEVESVTTTVKVEVTAAAVGVPSTQIVAVAMAPVGYEARARPAGRAPEVIAQVYGGTPPATARFCGSGLARETGSSVPGVIARRGEPGRMVSANPCCPVPSSVFESETPNIEVPVAAGTPEITPEEERLKPAGKLPAASDQNIVNRSRVDSDRGVVSGMV
jgi:hypothetical protein